MLSITSDNWHKRAPAFDRTRFWLSSQPTDLQGTQCVCVCACVYPHIPEGMQGESNLLQYSIQELMVHLDS